MKNVALLALASGMALVASSANAAVTISNTGATPNAWTVSGGGQPGYSGAAVTASNQYWEANSATSSWVSINAAGISTVAPTTSNGSYTYSTFFFGNQNDVLNFRFWADDVVTSMLVDGVAQTIAGGTYTTSTLGSFKVLTNTQSSHTLSFTVLNNGNPSNANATGFRFEQIGAAVPEPATWGMMIVGFGLMGGVLRRRSTKVAFA